MDKCDASGTIPRVPVKSGPVDTPKVSMETMGKEKSEAANRLQANGDTTPCCSHARALGLHQLIEQLMQLRHSYQSFQLI